MYQIMKRLRVALFFLLVCTEPQLVMAGEPWENIANSPERLHRTIKAITDIMVHDIYSPPVASRIYAYTTVAAYEAALTPLEIQHSFSGRLNDLADSQRPSLQVGLNHPLASVHATLLVARSLIISEQQLDAVHAMILKEFSTSGMPDTVFKNSLVYGRQVADWILQWAAQDRYKQTRSLAKYAVRNDAASWRPTPPAYMKAVEPNWGKLRTFLIDSAQLFRPPLPTPFSTDTASQFYREARAVQEAGMKLTTQQIEIANFWDCNPFKLNVNGHVMYATKKISPGGHWINITALACKQSNSGFTKSAAAYAVLSVALADAFISCWEEKFRSKLIRPETYINQHISQGWMPLLQTPPFPEYTSGHSVVSAAAAVILGSFFGDNFAFDDSTELEFKIPVRHFTSFKQAAEEAAISRFYGGIHYMPSIVNGLAEGEKLGVYVADRLIHKGPYLEIN